MQDLQSQQNPLSQMRPLHLPDNIEAWPWAPGWYILIALVLILLISFSLWLINKHRNNLYKRDAIKQLDEIQKAAETKPGQVIEHAQSLSLLYKRIALSHFPRSEISKLSGEQWLQFLDELSASQFFTQEEGQLLGESLFKAPEDSQNQQRQLQVVLQESENIIKKLKTGQLKKMRSQRGMQ